MTDATGETIRALGDPHRRALLDALRAQDARTVSDLERATPDLGRHAVLKHLGVLERAGLVVTEKHGRTRVVRLNAVPIVALAERWIDQYAAFSASALVRLREHLAAPQRKERIMTDTRTVVASIVIEASPERIWQALTDPGETARWFFGGRVTSDWTVGSPLVYLDADGDALISGRVLAIEPGVRLVHTWSATWSAETGADAPSEFEWLLAPEGSLTRVTIRHSGIPAGTATAEQVDGGNVTVLSSLKTFVETGRTMAGMG